MELVKCSALVVFYRPHAENPTSNTMDLELVQLLRDSIAKKGDQQAIKTMTTSQEILIYMKMKYLQNGSLVEATFFYGFDFYSVMLYKNTFVVML